MNDIYNRLTYEEHNGQKILLVDYHGLKENDMVLLATKAIALTLVTPTPFLADFNQTYLTSGFLKLAKVFAESHRDLKGALVGIDGIKNWIVKGFIMTYKVNWKTFDTKNAAITFLTSNASDKNN